MFWAWVGSEVSGVFGGFGFRGFRALMVYELTCRRLLGFGVGWFRVFRVKGVMVARNLEVCCFL